MSGGSYGAEYLQYQRDRSRFRKFVRRLYLWQVRRHCVGRVLDFGCGVGEHLRTFPEGSLGLEINPATVDFCQAQGLNVQLYNPEEDEYRLSSLPVGNFQTLVISHVLEHLILPERIFHSLLASASRLGIRRVFATVPCEAGFAHDSTHRTFINAGYLQEHDMDRGSGFQLMKSGYFPFPSSAVGPYFTYNEFYWVCEKRN